MEQNIPRDNLEQNFFDWFIVYADTLFDISKKFSVYIWPVYFLIIASVFRAFVSNSKDGFFDTITQSITRIYTDISAAIVAACLGIFGVFATFGNTTYHATTGIYTDVKHMFGGLIALITHDISPVVKNSLSTIYRDFKAALSIILTHLYRDLKDALKDMYKEPLVRIILTSGFALIVYKMATDN